MEPLQNFTYEGVLAGNPITKRSKRTDWWYNPESGELVYAVRKNVILKNLNEPKKSRVFNEQVAEDVTAVHTIGPMIAFGNAKGGIRVVKWLDD